MTIDKSLRRASGLARARNVLKRHERLEKLGNEDRWEEGQSVLHLPKTKVPKSTLGKKKKEKKAPEEGEAAAAGAAAPAAAPAPEKKPAGKK